MQKRATEDVSIVVDDDSLSDESAAAFIRDCFSPQKAENIVYTAAKITAKGVSELRRRGARIICARIGGNLAGIHIMLVSKTLLGRKRVFCPIRCVAENYRGRSVGRKMFELAEREAAGKCAYSFISTAFSSERNKKALENLGYAKWRLSSWPDSDYYSIVYRKDLLPSPHFWRLAYPASRLLCPLCKNADGSFTLLGKIFWKPVLALLKAVCFKNKKD